MKVFKIVKDTEKSLREKSIEVSEITEEIKEFALELVEHLKASQNPTLAKKYNLREGVGLAAPQVGRNIRIFAIYYDYEDENGNKIVEQHALINPKIISNSVKKIALSNGEGCLSVDGDHEGYVYRDYKILIKAFDAIQNKEVVVTARGYKAVVLQHEYDHLDGILYYDRINKNNPFLKQENAIIL